MHPKAGQNQVRGVFDWSNVFFVLCFLMSGKDCFVSPKLLAVWLSNFLWSCISSYCNWIYVYKLVSCFRLVCSCISNKHILKNKLISVQKRTKTKHIATTKSREKQNTQRIYIASTKKPNTTIKQWSVNIWHPTYQIKHKIYLKNTVAIVTTMQQHLLVLSQWSLWCSKYFTIKTINNITFSYCCIHIWWIM